MARSGFVSREGSNLVLDGGSFTHIGVNAPGIAYYGQGPLPASKGDQDVFLDSARCMGARVVRLFAGHRDLDPDRAAGLLWELADRALGLYGVRLLVSFTDFYTNYHHPRGDDGYYQMDANGYVVLSPAWYGGGFRDNYLPWVRAVVSRLREHPGVFAWELGNELKNLPNPQDFVTFAQQVVGEIRALDADHLITVGVISAAQSALTWAQAHQLYEGMDMVQVHVYGSNHGDNDLSLARDMGLPHIVGEAGYPPNNRVGGLQWDLEDWFFNLGSQGYYQWGFMPTNYDNGDGDRVFGMDRIYHNDFDALFQAYSSFTKSECGPPPPTRYRCSNGACVPDASGPYGSLAECQVACQPPPPTRYRCSNGVCVADVYGPYGSLAECQAMCRSPGVEVRIPLGLIIGGMLVLGAGGLILLSEATPLIQAGMETIELEEGQPIPPGYRVVREAEVLELEPGQPIPPGYVEVG